MKILALRAGLPVVGFVMLWNSVVWAEPSRFWVAGWSSDADGSVTVVFPFKPEGRDDTKILGELKGLPGRELYFLGPDGPIGTATVARIDDEPGPSACWPVIDLSSPLSLSAGQFYLGSTAPISVAPSEAIPTTDSKLASGIAAYLRAKGAKVPKVGVRIVRALKADLDGDGRLEGVVEAMTSGRDVGVLDPAHPPALGDFSVVAVGRWSDAGFEVTAHAGYIFGIEEPWRGAAHFQFVALPNYEDGRFHLAVSQRGYEWDAVHIYEWDGASLTPVATAWCGV